MKVAILYNDDVHLKEHLNPVERLGDAEVGDAARDVERALAPRHSTTAIAVGDSIRDAIRELRALRPDVVIHLCEGALGRPEWEANVSLLLEMLGLPHTGCDPIASALCQDKGKVKVLLRHRRIATPAGAVFTSSSNNTECQMVGALVRDHGRVIIKPVRHDGGVGVDATSVATTIEQAIAIAQRTVTTYDQPALVEAFIDGAEFNQAIYWNEEGPVLLPAGEVLFDSSLTPEERVVGWKAKWDAGSREDRATVNRTPAQIGEAVRKSIARICLDASRLVGLGGYCRFDLRQDRTGQLYIVDINPNPDIGPGTGFRKALDAAQISFGDFLEQLMMTATPKPGAALPR